MSEIRRFDTLDVVTVDSGVLVSDRGMDAIYDLCGWLLGDPGIMTHQLPAASRACQGPLREQFPWLAELDPPRGDIPALKAWCAALVEEHGASLDVTRPDDPQWVAGRALEDLHEMTTKPIIEVRIDDGE